MHFLPVGGKMAEPLNDGRTPERYEETTDPRNPPNSVANEAVRSMALRAYLGPLIALFVVVGLALIYWANRAPVRDGALGDTIGTTGERSLDVAGERGNDVDSPGGTDPSPRPDSTRDELESRGVGSPAADLPGFTAENTMTDIRQLLGEDAKAMMGRRVDIADARVTDASSSTMFWIEKSDARAAVSAPPGGPAVRNGQTVTVSGIVEPNGQGGIRIRATRVVSH
jgi:hypothetical protein